MIPLLKTMLEGALGSLTFGWYWYYVGMRDLNAYNKQIEDKAKLKHEQSKMKKEIFN